MKGDEGRFAVSVPTGKIAGQILSAVCAMVVCSGSISSWGAGKKKSHPAPNRQAASEVQKSSTEQNGDTIDPEQAGKAHGRPNSVKVFPASASELERWGFPEQSIKDLADLDRAMSSSFSVFVFNKATNRLYLGRYQGEKIELVKSFHSLFGKLPGDKGQEGDLKTPEGFYVFNSVRYAPNINRKLGEMAIGLNYPNPVDQIES